MKKTIDFKTKIELKEYEKKYVIFIIIDKLPPSCVNRDDSTLLFVGSFFDEIMNLSFKKNPVIHNKIAQLRIEDPLMLAFFQEIILGIRDKMNDIEMHKEDKIISHSFVYKENFNEKNIKDYEKLNFVARGIDESGKTKKQGGFYVENKKYNQ